MPLVRHKPVSRVLWTQKVNRNHLSLLCVTAQLGVSPCHHLIGEQPYHLAVREKVLLRVGFTFAHSYL